MPLMQGMGALGGILNTQSMMTDIKGAELLNAERAQLMEVRKRALERDSNDQAAMAATQQELAGGMGGVTPEALAEGEGNSPGVMGGMQAPTLSQALQKQAKEQELLAKNIAARGGTYEKWQKAQQAAEKALADSRGAMVEERKAALERSQAIYDLAGAARDEDSLNQVAGEVIARYGKEGQAFFNKAGLDKDPETGRLLWTDRNKKAVEAIQSMALKQVEREKDKDRDQAREDRRAAAEALDEDRKARREQAEAIARANQDLAQQRIDAARDRSEAQKEKDKQKKAMDAVKTVQKDLNVDPVYRDFTKYQGAMDLAQDSIQMLNDKDGFENFFKSPNARALGTAFQNIQEGFRARAGGKYTMQDLKQFNGFYQTLEKYVKTVGGGTPTFSESTAREVANAITGLYDIANKNAVIVSLEGKERVQKMGGDPSELKTKGDLQRLFRNGQARVITKDGKQVLQIGRPGQQVVEFADEPLKD